MGATAAGRSWPGHRQVAAAGNGQLRAPWPRPERCAAQGSRSGRGFIGVLPLWHAEGSADGAVAGRRRSEEHTSELQSLMRISYAVFCLKKKKKQTKSNPT